MPQIDLVDDTWIRAPLARVAAAVGDSGNWGGWFPRLLLQLHQSRGPLGVRWWVRTSDRHRLAGSMEIWLEPSLDGVLLHYFLRLDPAISRKKMSVRERQRLARTYALQAKRSFFALKDELEACPLPGPAPTRSLEQLRQGPRHR